MSQAGPTSSSSGGGGLGAVDTLTGNTGGAVGPDGANNIDLFGIGGNITVGNAGANLIAIDNKYWLTPYVVDSNTTPGSRASYSTIQSAINAANTAGGGVVYIRPGNYTENLTLYPAVNLLGVPLQSIQQFTNPFTTTLINGAHTLTGTGIVQMTGISFSNGAGIIFTFTSSGGNLEVDIENCLISNGNGDAILATGSVGNSVNIFIDTCNISTNTSTNAAITLGTACAANIHRTQLSSNSGDGIAVTDALTYISNSQIQGAQNTVVINGPYTPPSPNIDIFGTLLIGQHNLLFNAPGAIGCAYNVFVSFAGDGFISSGTGTFESGPNVFAFNNQFGPGLTELALPVRPRATAGTSGTAYAGFASFDSTSFTVTDGFVQFTGTSAPGPLNVTSVTNALSPYTVLNTDQFLAVNSSAGAVTIRLPNAPTTGQQFTIKDSNGVSATHNISITTVGGVVTIDGATTYTLNTNYTSVTVIFDGTHYEVM